MNNITNSPKIDENDFTNEWNKAKIELLRRTSQQKHIMRMNQIRSKLKSETDRINARYLIKATNDSTEEKRTLNLKNEKSKEKNQTSNISRPKSAPRNKIYPDLSKIKSAYKFEQKSKTDELVLKTSAPLTNNSKHKKFRSAPERKTDKNEIQDKINKNSIAFQRSLIPKLQSKSVAFQPKTTIIKSPRPLKKQHISQNRFANTTLPRRISKIVYECSAKTDSNIKRSSGCLINSKTNPIGQIALTSNKKINRYSSNNKDRQQQKFKKGTKSPEKYELKHKINKPFTFHKVFEAIPSSPLVLRKNSKDVNENEMYHSDKSKNTNFNLRNAGEIKPPAGVKNKNMKKEVAQGKNYKHNKAKHFDDIDIDYRKLKEMFVDIVCGSPNPNLVDCLKGKSSIFKLMQHPRRKTVPSTPKVLQRSMSAKKWKMATPDKFAALLSKRNNFRYSNWRRNSSSDLSSAKTQDQLYEELNPEPDFMTPNEEFPRQTVCYSENDPDLLKTFNSGVINCDNNAVDQNEVAKNPHVNVIRKLEAIKFREMSSDAIKINGVPKIDTPHDAEKHLKPAVSQSDDVLFTKKQKTVLPTLSTKSVQNCKIPVWQKFVQTLTENISGRSIEPKQLIRSVTVDKPILNLDF